MRRLLRITGKEMIAVFKIRYYENDIFHNSLFYENKIFMMDIGPRIGEVRLCFEYKDKVGEWFDLALIEISKLEALCKDTGWRIDKLVKSERGIYGVVLKKQSMRQYPF